MIGPNSTVRTVKETTFVESGREGIVLSAYSYPDKNGKNIVNYKVKFDDGPICVVKESDVEGGLCVG